MPITPLHFGPGLLGKGLVPRSYSWTAFCAANVAIDVESLYHLWRHDWPVHRQLHTFLGATLVALATSALLAGACALARSRIAAIRSPAWRAELAPRGIVIGALAGGLTHPILDGLMHADIEPFQPFTAANPLHALVGVPALHAGCIVAGVLGAVLLLMRLPRASRTPRS